MIRHAVISPCGLYRYSLGRWDIREGMEPYTITFILANPSTADANVDDPTVRRGIGYMKAWGYSIMHFVNVNPYRATNPRDVRSMTDEVKRENLNHVRAMVLVSDLVIAAWGKNADPKLASEVAAEAAKAKPLHYLELSKDGTPKHILYLRGDLQPQLWKECTR